MKTRTQSFAGPLLIGVVVTFAAAAGAAIIDLASGGHVQAGGAGGDERAGWSVADAGDVNGDGRPDPLVGAPVFDGRGPGSAFVVFTPAAPTTIDLGALGPHGYRIQGTAGESLGDSVANAGDVNGDGRPDALVGAPSGGRNGRFISGSVYVIFGRTSTGTVDVTALGSGGYRIDGAASGDRIGRAVAGAGDLNGDGRPDAIIGAPFRNDTFTPTDPFNTRGAVYVVFGKADTVPLDLSGLGSGGYVIEGGDVGDFAGKAVANAGDVNGDGRPDVLLAASREGSAYVVFGKPDSTSVNLGALGGGGYRIAGLFGPNAGNSVANAGDVNGDGRADALVGSPFATPGDRAVAGRAYVVFGKADAVEVDVPALGTRGYTINGAAAGDEAGYSVAAAGDIDGDGAPDAWIGARSAGPSGRVRAGSAYLVLNARSGETIDLADAAMFAHRIDGAAAGDGVGRTVSGLDDVTGDGRRDALVGAPFADFSGRTDAGVATVVAVPQTVRPPAPQPPPVRPGPPPPPPRPQQPLRCVVPSLKGKTLPQARRLLASKRCALGRVTRAKRRAGGS
jgi:FG-GAP-like repeat/FG-GAP repeat